MYTTKLAGLTTLRVGGVCKFYEEPSDSNEYIACIREADSTGTPLLVLGEGSNLLIADTPFEGLVMHPKNRDIETLAKSDGTCVVRAGAGCKLDDLVAWSIDQNLSGLEALSGIPGCLGSAVMQNAGAYGSEIGTSLDKVFAYDRFTKTEVSLTPGDLSLGYRTSALRKSLHQTCGEIRCFPSPRWIVHTVQFKLTQSSQTAIMHAQLAGALGCVVGDTASCQSIRETVLAIRASKGMLKDPDPCGPEPLYDRWSTGSFFTNPVLCEERFADPALADAPRYSTQNPGIFKTSAAWLIDHAGFAKGYGVHGNASKATLSTLHTLALTNRGNACATDILELAQTVKNGVQTAFGITLEPESILVGLSL